MSIDWKAYEAAVEALWSVNPETAKLYAAYRRLLARADAEHDHEAAVLIIAGLELKAKQNHIRMPSCLEFEKLPEGQGP